MKLLLDTHVFIWSVLDAPALAQRHRDALTSSDVEVFLSAVSVWEMSIKASLGKLQIPNDIFETALMAGCQPLSVSWDHARAVEALPQHHGDPFDRLLIAQARCEGMTLATMDEVIAKYDVPIL